MPAPSSAHARHLMNPRHLPPFRLLSTMLAVAISQLACVASPPTPDRSEPTLGTIFRGGDYSGTQSGTGPTTAAGAGANTMRLEDEEKALPKPRIIRGTDQVIAPPRATAPIRGASNTFKFEDAPVVEVANLILRDIANVDYVLHTPLNGSITLATRGRVTPDEAMTLLESALQANGILLARDSRGVYHVGRPETLKGVVASPRQTGRGPLPPGYGAVIVPLQYIGAPDMAAILKPLLPPDALVRVDTLRNLLVLVGTRSQAEGWLDLVNTFDIDLLKGMSVGVFPLKYANVREIEAAFQAMLGGSSGGTAAAAGTAPGTPPAAAAPNAAGASGPLSLPAPLAGALRILPIERLNSVLVVTPRSAYLETARKWIEEFDQPSGNSKDPELHVYEVQNGSAQHLSQVLNGIFGGQSPTGPQGGTGIAPGLGAGVVNTGFGGIPVGAPVGLGGGGFAYPSGATSGFGGIGAAGSNGGFGSSGFGSGGIGGGFGATGGFGSGFGQAPPQSTQQAQPGGVSTLNLGPNVRVVADALNNAVLVFSNAADWRRIEATLKRLDVPATQVLIEASIVEVTLTDDLEYGLQWAFSGKVDNGRTGTGTLSSLAPGNGFGGSSLGLGGFSYSVTNSLGQVRAVLQLLAQKSLIKVISSPSLMVLNNNTASIGVGTQQPIQTGTTVTGNGIATTSIQYKDTGVQLAVTPSVTSGNVVTMQINQSVTDVGNPDVATGQRSFLQRQIGSKVAVRSGETLVLGGLIRDNVSVGKSGIPLLQDIPVIGSAFGTTTRTGDRTELLVVLTPRVIRSDQEARAVNSEMRDRMKSFKAIEDRLRTNQPLDLSPAPAAEPAASIHPPLGSIP